MDLRLPAEIDQYRSRVRAVVHGRVIPLESDRGSYDAHDNIALPLLERLRAEVKAAGMWAPQMPRERDNFGSRLADHEGVQWLLGEVVMQVEVGRLLVMEAAWQLEPGAMARAYLQSSEDFCQWAGE